LGEVLCQPGGASAGRGCLRPNPGTSLSGSRPPWRTGNRSHSDEELKAMTRRIEERLARLK
jgi:hypothetical protein